MQSQINILPQYETKKILAKLKENYGISSFPENSLLAMRGKEKIYLFTGNINEKQISEIDSIAQIEGLGVYFAKLDDKSGDFEIQSTHPSGWVGGGWRGMNRNRDQENIRLTIEGVQLFQNQITKNIVELNSASQAEEWMMGRELLWEDIMNKKANSFNSTSPGWVAGGGERLREIASTIGAGLRVSGTNEFANINHERPKGFVVIKFKDDFLGCGKASAEKITNFIPKARRLKERS